MSKKKIMIWSDDLDEMTADSFIKSLEEFSKINGVELSEMRVEAEEHDGYTTIHAYCYRLETDEECYLRQEQEQTQKDACEKQDRQKYEELKKRFG